MTFIKRTYTIPDFAAAVDDLLRHSGDSWAAVRHRSIDRAFAERIMLAVTEVNGCRFCHYGHARLALRAGVTEDELRALAAGDFDALPPAQITALLFAQHYAESRGQPDPSARTRLDATYGSQAAREIVAHIRMIMLGNTFDALWHRLRGVRVPHSSIWHEIGVLGGMVIIVPAQIVVTIGRRLLQS